MKLSEVYALLEKELACEPSCAWTEEREAEITDICYDSRHACKGCVFVALAGARSDGHRFIPEAVQKGAVAVVCEDKTAAEQYGARFSHLPMFCSNKARRTLARLSAAFFDYPAEKLTLIGLTGTKGKTGTLTMLAEMLEKSGVPCGKIGTNGIDYAGVHADSDNSTPESYELHRIFADMVAHGLRYCLLEVTSQALMQERVYGLTFDTAVFTNLSPDHIGKGEHHDFEEYRAWKGMLFTMCKRALINADDEHTPYFREILEAHHVPYKTYSMRDKNADFYGSDESFSLRNAHMQTEYTLTEKKGETRRLSVAVPGKFAIYNSLCAIGLAREYGVPCEAIEGALRNVRIFGRTELVEHPKCPFPVLIDYAHNAASLEALFEAVKVYHPERIFCVFGCGGNRSRLRRFAMGEISGKNATLSIITSDNPRDEEPEAIMADILAGVTRTQGKYRLIRDRAAAIEFALEQAEKNDIVLLVGKGQQTYEEIRGVKYPFDERRIVKAYFDRL